MNLFGKETTMLVGKALLSLSSIMLCFLLSAADPALAENFSRVERQPIVVNNQQPESNREIASTHYQGYLRVFVAQPVSRFRNDLGDPHLHGVLGIPLDIQINLGYPDTLKGDIVYNDTGMYSDNIEVMTAAYEIAGHNAFSDPPSGSPYTAHWVDASAVATPGNPGADLATPPYTHKVFVEYVTRYS
jgi:hypothetical protein